MTPKTVQVPRWVAAGSIIVGAGALLIQAAIDVYQGVNGAIDLPSKFAQAWQMSLPTLFTLIFAAIGGCLLNARRWGSAFCLYAIVFAYMTFTASNSMDFVSNQTVGRIETAKAKEIQSRDIADLQNQHTLTERKELQEKLWRVYSTAKTADKDKALAEFKTVAEAPIPLQQAELETVKYGSGGILSKWFGWRPEAIQEIKAIALPILVMIGKTLGITLGFALWSPKISRVGHQIRLPAADNDQEPPICRPTPSQAATARLRAVTRARDMDLIKRWVDTELVRSANAKPVFGATIHDWFRDWCRDVQKLETWPSMTRFGRVMAELGVVKVNDGKRVVYYGVARKREGLQRVA